MRYAGASPGRPTIRTYCQASNLVALVVGAVLALYWVWTQGHPAETNEESWRQARLLILGTGLGGVLLANAVLANAAVALRGPHRATAGALLVAWLIVGALAAWVALRR